MYRANELKRSSYDSPSTTQHTLPCEDSVGPDRQRAHDHVERVVPRAGNGTSSTTLGTVVSSNSTSGSASTTPPTQILDRRPIELPDHVVIACPRRIHPSARAFRDDPSDKQEKINRYLDELDAAVTGIDQELRGFYKVRPGWQVAPWRLSHNGGSSLRWGFRTEDTQPLEDLTAVSGGLMVLLRNGTEYWEPGFGGTIEAGHTVCPMGPPGVSQSIHNGHRDTDSSLTRPVANRPWGNNVTDRPSSESKRSVGASYGPPYGELPKHWVDKISHSAGSHSRADGDDLYRRDSFGERLCAPGGLVHPHEDDYELAQLSLNSCKSGQTRHEEGELEQMYRREHRLTGTAAATSPSDGPDDVGYEADDEPLAGLPFDEESFSDPAVPGLNMDWIFPIVPSTRIYEDPVKHDQGQSFAHVYGDASVSPFTSAPSLRYVERPIVEASTFSNLYPCKKVDASSNTIASDFPDKIQPTHDVVGPQPTWPQIPTRQEASNDLVVDMCEGAEQAREGANCRPKDVFSVIPFVKSIGNRFVNFVVARLYHRPRDRSFRSRRDDSANMSGC
ncbi:hypothetical protein J4E83_009576 [Alternaria metachromatica]|uniref:uncharacterized protein n=1 Tax=Alternaria metachromatica TaxID=283354 RepID=UPI0020C28867|nr:uncharacterized protein J4E83_009576 [Alternaria metachromatica]KAI4607393.1 hypothetical protein J4E83_009576 [Alternaria metachromatica]